MSDMEGIEGSCVDSHAGASALQIFNEEAHILAALGEASAEALEEAGAPLPVVLNAQILEFAEDLEFVGKQIHGAAVEQHLAVAFVEFDRALADGLLAL